VHVQSPFANSADFQEGECFSPDYALRGVLEARFIFVYHAVRGKGMLGVGRELGAEGWRFI
jgi:hypothetical protein